MIRNSFLRTLTRASLVALFPFSAADKIVHWNQAMKQAKSGPPPFAGLAPELLLAGVAVETIAPLCIVTGRGARGAATVLAGFCVATALLYHPFWKHEDLFAKGKSKGREEGGLVRDSYVTGTLLRRPGPPKALGPSKVVIEDTRLVEVLDSDAPLLCLYEHATFSEGVVWDARRERLIWSDVDGRRVLAWYPDGHVETAIDATYFINGNAVDRAGRLVHCEHGRRCISQSNDAGEATPFLTHFEGKRFNSPNDITLAPDGTLWFSDPTFGLNMPNQGSLRAPELDHRSVYRHDPDSGEVRRMADFEQPNGLAFSPDGRILYVSDTARALGGETHDIIAFDIAPDGSLSGRRLFQSVEPGIPDGFVVDSRGWIWTTSQSGVQIFTADGAKLGLIPTPNVCANLDFGGSDGRRLFVAAKTMLLAIDLR